MTDLPPRPGVVAGAIEALRFNPMVVGVLLLNMLFVVGGIWYLTSVETQRNEHLKLILERCLPNQPTPSKG
jgi:formate-dependent nitrite reductase membrane component NrfD